MTRFFSLALALVLAIAPETPSDLISPERTNPLEINMQHSVEGLAFSADIVACGHTLRTSPSRGKGGEQLLACAFVVTEGIKGVSTGDTICLTERIEHEKSASRSEECLIFLSQTEEGYAKDGMSCDKWPLRAPSGPALHRVFMDAPTGILSADGFRMLHTAGEIVEACRRTAAREAAFRKANPDAQPKVAYLSIPKDTDAWQSLYAGSSCYLMVPDFMYSEAKPSFY